MPLTVHFLNVGQGDCTIIEFPSGSVAIVDIDNLRLLDDETRDELLAAYRESDMDYLLRKAWAWLTQAAASPLETMEEAFLRRKQEELTDPLEYLERVVGRKDVYRLVVTHPDMDHMTGLCRLCSDKSRRIVNFWHSGPHNFNLEGTSKDGWGRYDVRDWETYKVLRAGKDVKPLQPLRGQDAGWAKDGIAIWSPSRNLERLAEDRQQSNILSMVLRLTHGGRSIVLGGDATAEESWPEIMESGIVGHVDVLKASHHGRTSGYHREAVKAMSPKLTITSVGDKAHDATNNYRRHSDRTVSLRNAGDIVVTIGDRGKLEFSKNVSAHAKDRRLFF